MIVVQQIRRTQLPPLSLKGTSRNSSSLQEHGSCAAQVSIPPPFLLLLLPPAPSPHIKPTTILSHHLKRTKTSKSKRHDQAPAHKILAPLSISPNSQASALKPDPSLYASKLLFKKNLFKVHSILKRRSAIGQTVDHGGSSQ